MQNVFLGTVKLRQRVVFVVVVVYWLLVLKTTCRVYSYGRSVETTCCFCCSRCLLVAGPQDNMQSVVQGTVRLRQLDVVVFVVAVVFWWLAVETTCTVHSSGRLS